MLINTLPAGASKAIQEALGITDQDLFQNADVWTCDHIKAGAAALEEHTQNKTLGTRVQYLSRYRKHLRDLGVPKELLLVCDAYKPSDTEEFNAKGAARRLERAEEGLHLEFPDWAKIDSVQVRIEELVLLAREGQQAFAQLFNGKSVQEEAKTLGVLYIQFAARPHELVPGTLATQGKSGALNVNSDGVWVGMLKTRAKARKNNYDPVATGLPVEDARLLLTAITSCDPVALRRALRNLGVLLKPYARTPRDLRAIGAEYAVQRSGARTGLPAEEVRAQVLRHAVTPSETALSAYQRIPAVEPQEQPQAAGNVLADLVHSFSRASPEIQALVLALLK